MRTILGLIIVGTTLLSTTGQAQNTNKFYANVGYSSLDLDLDSFGVIGARLGYELTPNIAIEAEAGVGAGSKKVFGIDIKVDNTFGGYLVGKLPLTDHFELLARVGYSHITVGATDFSSASGEDGSAAYGIGAQYIFDEKNGVRGDYTRYQEDNSGFNGFSVSYVRKF